MIGRFALFLSLAGFAIVGSAFPGPATAQIVAEAPDEARIRALAKTLRCPVCQSESILESRSSTAQEMMKILREMAAAGRSDAEITEFFRSRYGDFVMLAPPSRGVGVIIWALPLALLVGGGGVLIVALRRGARRRAADPPPEGGSGRGPERPPERAPERASERASERAPERLIDAERLKEIEL